MVADMPPLAIDAPIALWLIDGAIPPDDRQLGWLGAEERERANRFRSHEHRYRYLAVHVALRRLVAQECGIPPDQQCFEQSALGKWHLVTQPDWQLSLSYSGSIGMIGLARGGEIGIDVEGVRAIAGADDIAPTIFDTSELAIYRRLPGTERSDAFLRGWTRKEACLKAIGTGLSLSPAEVHTGLGGGRRVIARGRVLDLGSFHTGGLIGAWARTRPDQ